MEEEEDAEEDGISLLLDEAADSSGQVRLAFCPLTTTRLEPDLPLFAGWSDCSVAESEFVLRSSAK